MRPIDADAIAHKLEGKFNQDMVRYAPTLDYKDLVPQGTWKKETLVGCEPYYLCSICGKLHDQDYDFCNGCGARLRGIV